MNKAQAIHVILTADNKAEKMLQEAGQIASSMPQEDDILFVTDEDVSRLEQAEKRLLELQAGCRNLLLLRAEAEMAFDFANINPRLN